MRSAPLIVSVLAGLTIGCGPAPEPVYDDDLGLNAVAVLDGSLSGRFALWISTTQRVDVPFLGDAEGGSDAWALVDRTWDGAQYSQCHKVCGGYTWPVAGAQTTIPAATWRSVPESAQHTLFLDDATGAYRVSDHLELWGLRNLPDPYRTPLPADSEEAASHPFHHYVYDTDGDGHPGMTAEIDSIFDGEVYFVQRRIVDLKGIVRGEDLLLGLISGTTENRTIGASRGLLDRNMADPLQDPDPLKSWFRETRLPDDATCDDVLTRVADGRLTGERPF